MGYFSVIAMVAVVLVVLFVGLMSGSKKLSAGKLPREERKAPGQPSADAPTPAQSVVESNAQVEQARKRTPPA